MKNIFGLLFLFLYCQVSFAQDCYQVFFDEGRRAFEALDFEKAINQFNAAKICDDIPDNNEVDEWILKTQSGYIDAIRAARDEAIQLKKEAVALRSFVKGQEREFKGFYKEAIDEYSSAVDLIPADTLFREQRSQLAMSPEVEEYKMAKADLQFLIKNGNKNKRPGYRDNLAYVLEQMNDFNAAIVAQTSARNQAPVEQKELYNSKVKKLEDKKKVQSSGIFGPNTRDGSEKGKNSIIKLKNNKGYQDCDLQIEILINGKTLKLQNNGQIKLDDLPFGTFQYEIKGNVKCQNKPSWPAIGKGTISIREDSVYYLYWELTKYGKCEMWVNNY